VDDIPSSGAWSTWCRFVEVSARARETVLVTGFPAAVARHAAGLLASEGTDVILLVERARREEAEAFAAGLGGSVRPLEGEASSVDLGLGGAEAAAIQQSLSALYHLAREPGDDRAALRGAREICEFAAGGRSTRLVVLDPAIGGRRGARRSAMSAVLGERGAGLGASILRTGVCTAADEASTFIRLVVLLHLCLDIRRLRSVAGRRVVLTDAGLAARVALRSPAGVVDLRDPRPPTLAGVDRALTGMIEARRGVDPDQLSSLRRHRDRLIVSWIGNDDPVNFLASWTVDEAGGSGEGIAREMGLEWMPVLGVLEACIDHVLECIEADAADLGEDRDALLG